MSEVRVPGPPSLTVIDIADRKTEVNGQVIEMLEHALAAAHAGVIQEAVLVSVGEDGDPTIAYSASLDPVRRVGLLEIAKADFVREWLG